MEKNNSLKGNNYNSRKLAECYNYHSNFGAVFDDIIESQYGIKDGIIKDPTRHYFFYAKLLNLVQRTVTNGSILIDIGCGMGILAEAVSYKVNKYIGVDISIERIRQSRERIKYPHRYFVVADAEYLPFKDSSFNTAISLEVIEHLPDTDLFIKEVNRILIKRGVFVLSTPASLFFENNIERLYKDQHLYEFSPRKLKYLLKRNSFYIESIKGIGFKSPKLKIPIWFGSNIIKYIYKKIKNTELKSGYGHPISLQFDIVSNPFFNKLYFKLQNKKPWVTFMEIFGFLGKFIPAFSSDMVIVCLKN